jgi:hypothetical protein
MQRGFVLTILLATACARGTGGGTTPADAAGFGPEVQQAWRHVRAATRPYHTLDSAVAAGYAANVTLCYADSMHGAMGYHHLNSKYVDNRIEVERPEILLYERRADGSYALNGVEYIIPYRVWPRDSVPPTVMGRDMLRSDELNLWYTHMWVWKHNAEGLFANWNPDVQCRAE